jgi:hypothetical protein
MNDITSVSESLQGKTPSNSTPAARYAMETQNSTTSIAALITKFTTFENEVARKKMETIHQYYKSGRNISLERSSGYAEYEEYMPEMVQDIRFSVSIKESAESPVARMMLNDLIKEMWAAGAITAEQMLSYSYYPGSEGLLQTMKANREAVEQGEAPMPIPQEQMQQVAANSDLAKVQMLQQALAS